MTMWIIATVCAFFVKGLCGFANTLIFTTIMSFGVSNAMISPVELLTGYPTNLLIAWKERRSIDWKLCLPLTALVIAGSVPGILLLKSVDVGAIKLLFGVLIVFLGVEMLLRERRPRKGKASRAVLVLIGVLSGVLCGLYGVGALLGAYFGRVARDTSAFKGNMCFVFAAENTLRIALYAATGILNAGILVQAIRLVPFMLVSLALGMKSAGRLDERIARRLVMVMLIVSGISLIAGQL